MSKGEEKGAIRADIVIKVHGEYDADQQKYDLGWKRLKSFATRYYHQSVPLISVSKDRATYEINKARQILENFRKSDPELNQEIEQRRSGQNE